MAVHRTRFVHFVGNGLCAVLPSSPAFEWYVEWHPVRPNRVPFNRAFRPVGLWPLRGRNGTQAVPYDINAQEAFVQVGINITGHCPPNYKGGCFRKGSSPKALFQESVDDLLLGLLLGEP